MRGECFLVRTHFGNLTLDVHEDPATGEPIEIIVSAGAAGSDLMADAVALGMAASVLLRLRSDVPALERVEVIADKFRNIGGAKNGAAGLGVAASLAQGIALGLDTYLEAARQPSSHAEQSAVSAEPVARVTTDGAGGGEHGASLDVDLCPSCGRYSMEMVEGCRTCRECGFSKCS
jgi:ribonucleoside-diphosphate reductase alpha chain